MNPEMETSPPFSNGPSQGHHTSHPLPPSNPLQGTFPPTLSSPSNVPLQGQPPTTPPSSHPPNAVFTNGPYKGHTVEYLVNAFFHRQIDSDTFLSIVQTYPPSTTPPLPEDTLQTPTPQPSDQSSEFPSLPRKRTHTDTDGYTLVTKGAKTPKPNTPPPTPVSNQFDKLPKVKPIPLVLPRNEYEPSQVSSWLRSALPQSQYQILNTKTEIKIFPTTNEVRSSILSLFQKTSDGVSFYTYAPKGTPLNKKFLILGLDVTHPLDNVKSAIQHPDLIFVSRLSTTDPAGKKTPIDPILATFKPSYDPKDHILQLKHIDQVLVKIKPYNPAKTIPQCHRCQRYGHTKNHCFMKQRCVRCSGEHHVSQCDRATQQLKCANCSESHPASYTQCVARLQLLKEVHAKRAAAVAPPSFIPAPPPTTNAWTSRQTSSQPSTQQNPPISLPLPTPQASPAPPLIPQPPIVSYNTPPPWMNELQLMFTNMMNTMNRLLDLLVKFITK